MATKGAIISLTKHIALRYATKRSIRANCLCPGSVWTDMTKRELAAQPNYSDKANEFNASIGQHSSAGVGISNTADMANILVFLASDESKAINGQIITADYGCNL
jgi:NAD(P)-dependent dehydrogenase (short-subunit alcohol dehydrogenase family)